MIRVRKTIEIANSNFHNSLIKNDESNIFENAIFLDLEHYVYKKPICIGVFGSCTYDRDQKSLIFTQYMIEKKEDAHIILKDSREYFKNEYNNNFKRYLVTFSGNNDFLVMKYLFNKYHLNYKFDEIFKHIDLQKEYESVKGNSIGLKPLEKEFGIKREGGIISGSNLAKTFSKLFKDKTYINRIPSEKVEKILHYNEQDVVNLFHIFVNWGNMNIK